jgi:hypothetical protein
VVIALALVVAAAGISLTFIDRSAPEPPSAARSIGPVSDSPTPSPSPTVSASPTDPVVVPIDVAPCTSEFSTSSGLPVADPAAAEDAVVADYRFERSLASSAGSVPNLAAVGNNPGGYERDPTLGRAVRTFAQGGGLVVGPPSAIVEGEAYSIELVIRLDRTRGYHKLINFKRSSDDGLYELDGCLTFYPEDQYSFSLIEPDTWVQVVLTRDGAARVTVYLNGLHAFDIRDTRGRAEIDAAEALWFFKDDPVTEAEYSSGSVSRIRFFDRPLTAAEVAGIACTQLPSAIDVAPELCES